MLNNPAERCIVDNHRTGLIVSSAEEFAQAVEWLQEHPKERQMIGKRAAESIRKKFTAEKMEASLNVHYNAILSSEKTHITFTDFFGGDPADWFLSCQGYPDVFCDNGISDLDTSDFRLYGLREPSKGTVFHFQKYFPDNNRLNQWAKNMLSY